MQGVYLPLPLFGSLYVEGRTASIGWGLHSDGPYEHQLYLGRVIVTFSVGMEHSLQMTWPRLALAVAFFIALLVHLPYDSDGNGTLDTSIARQAADPLVGTIIDMMDGDGELSGAAYHSGIAQ